MEAQLILPVELWRQILKPLKLSTLIQVQHVCRLFWNIVQDFVHNGDLKTDYYSIRRPFQDVNHHQSEEQLHFYYINQDKLQVTSSVPFWLLGAGFHGPYAAQDESIKNFDIKMSVESQRKLIQERLKHCRVKFPAVILPLFFDQPVKLEANTPYIISMFFNFSETMDWPAYIIEYPKNERVDYLSFYVENCVMKETCQCAYVQCGHIRFLYVWPINYL